ncbi:putative ATP-dependent RNA helicase [Trypanosoma cruzi]|uniref:ATP-dependent RNA helicase n=2 Tax=Trypanosoma cruzi TaxID=5693 RepID=Q4DDL8_TRYCC|nr:ATP-dependent RNA helicase, putative [Trypanosoma cruzi]EAN90628.1 ATP-dependent RNA helicase, putative [Trypanosoma cruzi]PWV02087.1 putative ATP-dependent RNA helicase [Trypanosoma cruzi]RNC44004.1 putative Atp-dependent RNA helicase [Trypanosoma cruzi]|eukprot:XP_812479.1 ATP-dependent RNA helicase [Trypanosoma cruzi strain CL Brener]
MDEDRRRAKQRKNQQRWLERQERSRLNRAEIRELRTRIEELRALLDSAEGGDRPGGKQKEAGEPPAYTHFNQLPLSQRTQLGLERGGYKRMTPIQSDALHLALAGYDVLGAAKTGSGKTLCFVVPVLERLFVEQWDTAMGVGALVLSPTRELALQIFKVLQLVGYKHTHSAALLTGGRDVEEERKRLAAISVIVGTPGRVLHHLEDDADLVTDNMQLFVMDEADRLLDMGFRDAICGIMRHLPTARQTLLFSATQTTDVQMLAQMSLRNQRYVTTHASTAAPTPATLCQNFIVVELHRKLDALLMFLKRHPNDKTVVFVSTCNQVRYMYLAFSKILKKMRIPSMCLTSKMKQFRREEVFLTFCRCKAAVLFCTDIAARGLDFPLVHWAVQYDCPDSAQTYIHRAGRTARAGARGVSLLFLTPQETPMLSFLAHKHIPLREIAIRPGLLQESKEIFVALVVQGLKYEAQKAFIAYLRSVYFAANKLVFDVNAIDFDAFAHSLGLLKVPNMAELRNLRRGAKNLPWDVVNYMARQEGQQEAQKQHHVTRREKHLGASDMFRTLQQKQRYAVRDDDDDDNNNNIASNEAKGRYVGPGRGDDDDEDEGEDYDDGFLVQHRRTNSTHQRRDNTNNDGDESQQQEAASMRLTPAERIAGLSKRKVRRFIQAADLRVRDLGLSERIVFDDEDEEEEEEEDEEAKKRRVALLAAAVASKSERSEDEGDDDDDYAGRLRERVLREAEKDADRAKRLRRLRRLQRDGKIKKSTPLSEAGVTAANGGRRPAHGGDNGVSSDEYDDDYDSGSTTSLSRIIKAAKGELYSDDDGTSASSEDDDTAVRPKKKARHAYKTINE